MPKHTEFEVTKRKRLARARTAATQRDRRNKLKQAGLCIHCGAVAVLTRCKACMDNNRKLAALIRQRKKDMLDT